MRHLLLALPIVGLGAVGALAQPKANCADPRTQFELTACAVIDAKAADAKLNALYRGMVGRYGAEDKRLLQKAEQAWIAFRDAECAFEVHGTAGGSINPMVAQICLKDLTLKRVVELKHQLDCPEGDTGCNRPSK